MPRSKILKASKLASYKCVQAVHCAGYVLGYEDTLIIIIKGPKGMMDVRRLSTRVLRCSFEILFNNMYFEDCSKMVSSYIIKKFIIYISKNLTIF